MRHQCKKLEELTILLELVPISKAQARRFVVEYHYAHDWGSIGNLYLGLKAEGELVGVAIWGYGVRPLATIKGLFPSLASKDYRELNRLCVLDKMPRNTESQFISLQVRFIKRLYPGVKVLFSWADGLRGKPGYIYQASSWLYGGFIESEYYINTEGETLHPRFLITRYETRAKNLTERLGLRKVHGYQFRYCKLVCGHKERRELLHSSPLLWTQDYPKTEDAKCWIDAGEGSRESYQPTMLKGTGRFRNPASLLPGLDDSAYETPHLRQG